MPVGERPAAPIAGVEERLKRRHEGKGEGAGWIDQIASFRIKLEKVNFLQGSDEVYNTWNEGVK
jgi:hypothetical protein